MTVETLSDPIVRQPKPKWLRVKLPDWQKSTPN